jgi:hypothetical protein
MVLALIIIPTSWILILSVIVGLCRSAHQGDLQQLKDAPAHHASDPTSPSLLSPQITTQPGRRVYPCNPAGITSSATSATG